MHMNSRAFVANIAIIVALMALASAVEVLLPLFGRGEAGKGRRVANLSLTALAFALNWILTSLTATVALGLSVKPTSVFAKAALPLAVQIALTVLILDFTYGYVSHALMHKIPILWRFHRVHHSDPFVDVTTSFRNHPLEGLWRFLFMMVPAWTLGLPAAGIVTFRLISTVNGVLEHANVRLWRPLDRVVSRIWCTPNMHKVHHSSEQNQTDSNYGNILSLYDRAFGTFTDTGEAYRVAYGLEQTDSKQVRSFLGLLAVPFERVRKVSPH